MTSLTVLVLAILTLFNLLLTVGVVRRLRKHSELLSALDGGVPVGVGPVKPAVGEVLPDFAVTTVQNAIVTRQNMTKGTAVLGFFTTDCAPCLTLFPDFLKHLSERRYDNALIVLNASADGRAQDMARQAGSLAHVAVVADIDDVAGDLGVDRFPTVISTTGGVVRSNGASLGTLLVGSAA